MTTLYLTQTQCFTPMLTFEEPQYEVYKPGKVDFKLLTAVMARHNLKPNHVSLMLPFGGHNTVGRETRRLYFANALDNSGQFIPGTVLAGLEEGWRTLPTTRIISFGRCNVACPYCKRDCQFIDDHGNPIISLPVTFHDIAAICEGAVDRGEIVRFSGGDPVVFPRETLALAEYIYQRHGVKVSIAHNGSGTAWVKRLAPYLSSAAIDLKAVPEKMGQIMGIPKAKGVMMYEHSLQTQPALSHEGVLLDVRTPVFGDTSEAEMECLAEDICRVNDLRYTFWTWRMYKPVQDCDFVVPELEPVLGMIQRVSSQFPQVWMGIRAKWEKGGMLYIKAGAIRNQSQDTENQIGTEFGSGNKL